MTGVFIVLGKHSKRLEDDAKDLVALHGVLHEYFLDSGLHEFTFTTVCGVKPMRL